MTFDDFLRVQRGIYRINQKDFAEALAESIGASREYASACWAHFRDNPMGYMTSRNPSVQGERLLAVAWAKGAES